MSEKRVCAASGCEVDLTGEHGKRIWCSERCRRREVYTNVCECGNTIYNGTANPDTVCGECKHEARYGERNELLIEMWEAGEPTWYIAERLGMQPMAVIAWIDRQRRHKGRDLPLRRKRNRDRWDEIEALWHEGLTRRKIAERLGMSDWDVGSRVQNMRKAGIDLPMRSKGRKVDA